jgi:hypothetical protein
VIEQEIWTKTKETEVDKKIDNLIQKKKPLRNNQIRKKVKLIQKLIKIK